MQDIAQRVKHASLKLAGMSTAMKNQALAQIARALQARTPEILAANREDLRRSEAEHLAKPLLQRLKFDESKIADVVKGLESLIKLEEPVGKTLLSTELDAGLELYKVSCPIGVIGVIFESRPDALVQISSLCLKSGNGVLLKGGSEARETNRILASVIRQASEEAGMPPGWIALLETRADVDAMLKMDAYIDLVIPRGSNAFVQYIMDHTKIPVMGHADGICHVYVDADVDQVMALRVVLDSKTQSVATCNAVETLLVHAEVAASFLPALKTALDAHVPPVEIIGCARTCAVIAATPAPEGAWDVEHLDYKLSVRVVDGLEAAMEHINTYGSGHTDTICTRQAQTAARFMEYVDSGNVFWNCSTRFSDGFKYGFGAEVGISTGKLHARGPVGLDGLLIYKYKLIGHGQVVDDYAQRARSFTHRTLQQPFEL